MAFAGAPIAYFPVASVCTAAVLPFTCILTPGNVVLSPPSLTVPLTVMFCACATFVKRKQRKVKTESFVKILFILFGYLIIVV
ncbi:hypothetical protein D3C87_1978630 [compost metagenome]